MSRYNTDKIDEMALALLYLTFSAEDNRAWKGMAWEVTDRLFEKGWIHNPENKNKTLDLTPEGRAMCVQLFKKHFMLPPENPELEPPEELPIDIDFLLQIVTGQQFSDFCLDRESGQIFIYHEHDPDSFIPAEQVGTRYLRIPKAMELAGREKISRKNARKLILEWLAQHDIVPRWG